MKCDFCGAEIPDGSVYCLKCGKGVQVVPDFDELEEELLPAMVNNEKKTPSPVKKKKPKKNKDKNRKIKIAVTFFALLLLLCGALYSYINSYDYAFKKAKAADKNKKYAIAADYYEIALVHKNTTEALLGAGIDYTNIKDYERAEERLSAALKADSGNSPETEAIYRALLDLYDKSGDYSAMEDLKDSNKNPKFDELFEEYYINPPVFSEKGGDFDDDVELELSSEDGYDIYYTTDDTTPSSHNGTLYSEPITIKKGETTINACCVNDDDKWGRIVTETYSVSYKSPSKPSASPSGGTFHEPMYVELTTKAKHAQIYYSWDGSDPTKESFLYDGPILIPEGNNVLSAIVIDKHDMASKVLKCNYVYIP